MLYFVIDRLLGLNPEQNEDGEYLAWHHKENAIAYARANLQFPKVISDDGSTVELRFMDEP